MTGSAPRSLPRRNTAEDSARDIVEAWLHAGGSDPLALQAGLTAAFIAGDETAFGSEVWRLVCEANETGWADDRLSEALSRALAGDMQQTAAGASLSD